MPALGTIPFAGGQTRANNGEVALAADSSGTLALHPLVDGDGTVHAVVDVAGYFVGGARDGRRRR